MTEHLTPEEFDELASAYLDNELDETSAARVENDADLLARVDELANVRDKVSATPAASPAIRAEHLATALAAFDQIHTAAPPVDQVDSPAAVTSLADRRSRRRLRTNRSDQSRNGMPGWLSAAAASVAVLGGVAVYSSQQQGTTDEMNAEAGEWSEASASDGSGSFSIESSQSELIQEAGDAMAEDLAGGADESSAASDAADDALEAAVDEDASSSQTTTQALGSVNPVAGDAGVEESADSSESDSEEEKFETPLSYPTGTPVEAILLDVGPLTNDVTSSNCAPSAPVAVSPAGDPLESIVGYHLLDLGGVPTEILIYGPETASLVDATTCELVQ